MQTQPTTRKDRILYALKQVGVEDIKDLNLVHNSPEYAMVYRQLFGGKSSITLELIAFITKLYPQISMEYMISGIGLWERNKIVTPPQHRQDIHLDAGATAAITQSGEARIEAPKEETKEPDIATMIRNNDLGGLVAIIMQQKDEIIRLKEQRIHDLETSVRIADANLFPPVK